MNRSRRKRIAVFMAGCQSDYGRKTMEGIIRQANSLNYDVMTFSFFSNQVIEHPFQTGEENVFNIFNPKKADGIIVVKNSFHKKTVQDKLKQICETSGLPFIELEDIDDDTEFPLWKDRELFCMLTLHMIEKHSMKKIYCFTGIPGLHQTENRLEGYRDAMRSHGLYFDDSYVFYGDYWENAAKELARDIAEGKIEKPEAIVCANGFMAINLTNSLIENGISVPGEIAVAGYDSFYQNALNSPTITTISNINYNQGVNIVCRLHKLITGEVCNSGFIKEERIESGGSCGCCGPESDIFHWYKKDISEQLHYTDLLETSNMLQQISIAENLNDFAGILSNFVYLIRGLKKIYLCICNDWDGINNTENNSYRKEGYTDDMLLYVLDEKGFVTEFSSGEMLPSIYSSLTPSAYYFIPLHYEDRCFGYVSAEFDNVQFSYDKQFWIWTDNVSTAIEALRIRNHIRRFSERIHLTAIRDPLSGLYNRRGFEELSSEFYVQSINNREKFLIIAFEIINLRVINKELGYGFGDSVITTIADAVNSSCRGNEICCRYGQERFYIVGSADYTREAVLSHISAVNAYCKKNITETEVILENGFYCDRVAEGVSLADIIHNIDSIIEKNKNEKHCISGCIKSFSQLRKQIYAQPYKKWTIDEMAQLMLLSRAYFQRLYKKEFGVSVMTDVISARMDLAKRLLVTDKRSISEIASACGYESEVYFMQQFKKVTGITPTQYRKEKISL
ncbi:MAG: AraC family transcriptional regulator [Porcipelethomonas sp.]